MAPDPALSDTENDGLLGGRPSLTGKAWHLREIDERAALGLAQRHNLPDALARALIARDVDEEGTESYLAPSLREFWADPNDRPHGLKDMDAAVARLMHAIQAGEKIAIFGDYDVDGATSAAVLHRYLSAVYQPPRLYVPDRMKEGYGPNAAAMQLLAGEGAQLVITVDCGTTGFEALAAAREAGLDVIVLDHHDVEARLPDCAALVNPKRVDEEAHLFALYGHVAAVGVAFMAVTCLNSALREAGWFTERAEPNVLNLLDVVALGTVADVVKLQGINRAFVRQGLQVMAQRRNMGLAALADIGGLDEAPSTYHLGFVFGPRINAGGRVGQSDLGARLLTTENPAEAQDLAAQLDGFNAERKDIEAMVQEQAMAQAEAAGGAQQSLIVAASEGWHPGVIGIVAGRLKEHFDRPSFVIAIDGDMAKGSGRSIKGIDLGQAVTAAKEESLLINGGGHEMAAGITIDPSKIQAFAAFLNTHLAGRIAALSGTRGIKLDGILAVTGATAQLADMLEAAGPYGAGNAAPRFAVMDAQVVKADVVGADHVRLILSGKDGGRLKAMAFRAAETPLGEGLLYAAQNGQKVHVVGTLKADRWMGREEGQLFVEDAALAD